PFLPAEAFCSATLPAAAPVVPVAIVLLLGPKLAACPPRRLQAACVIFRTQDRQISAGTLPSAPFRRRPFSEKRRCRTHHRFPSRVDSCKRPISFSPTICSSLYSATRRPLGTRSVRRS